MDKLWAPWRIKYVQKTSKNNGCIFCAASKSPSKKTRVFLATRHSIAMLNIFPYNNGHVMVAPRLHVDSLAKLSDAQALDLIRTLEKVKDLLSERLHPDGFNIGINIGRSAGAGIPDHLHIHIVPRWNGDTNFMPVFYKTKVISQSLDELYKLLTHAHTRTH